MLPILFQQISVWIIVLPFLVGIMNYKGLNQDARWIFLLVLVAMPPQIITGVVHPQSRLINLSYNLYTPVELSILYLLFVSKFTPGASRIIMLATALLFVLVYLFFTWKYGLQKRFLNEVPVVCNLLYMVWTFLLLKQEFESEHTTITKENPFTWFLLGIVLSACGRTATMPLYHYIRNPQQSFRETLTIIDSVFNILLYLFFSVGLLISRKHIK